MTTILSAQPRTGRLFAARVILSGVTFPSNRQTLIVGCKSTAGAPTTTDDLDVGATAFQMLLGVSVVNIRHVGAGVNGVLNAGQRVYTHAPGANVKVYAAFRADDATDSDPLTNVSAGVLLAA